MLTIPEQFLFGLDISQSKLRLVQIRTGRKQKIITALREVTLPAGVIVDGEIADPRQLTRHVAAIVRGRDLHDRLAGNGVISVLPENKTFVKLVAVGGSSPAELEEALREEIPRQIPLPIADLVYDWQLIGPAPPVPRDRPPAPAAANTPAARSLVLVGAAERRLVDAYRHVLGAAGLLTYALEVEAAAITRCLLPAAVTSPTGGQIIIDLGAFRTGLIIVRRGVIQFTVSLPISGRRVTDAVADTLKITSAEAEEAKLVCGLDDQRCQGALRRVLYAMLDDLERKIDEAISFYCENFEHGQPLEAIILSGGGANFLQIDRVLTERIRLPARIADPLTNVALRQPIAASTLQSYVTAIGLALRGTQKDAVI